MKKLVIAFVVVIVGFGSAGYVWSANKSEQPKSVADISNGNTPQAPAPQAEEPAAAETTTVTYDENGFSPTSITVTKGTTITFVSNSDMPLWVASNPHPAHTDYPDFDTAKALGRMPKMGESFTFTFDKPGTWTYHSHTASTDTGTEGVHPGTITVE